MKAHSFISILILLIFSRCTDMNTLPPKSDKQDKILEIHGDTRVDPYYWLNERENPNVISYLEEENNYSKSVLKSTEKFQRKFIHNYSGSKSNSNRGLPKKQI